MSLRLAASIHNTVAKYDALLGWRFPFQALVAWYNKQVLLFGTYSVSGCWGSLDGRAGNNAAARLWTTSMDSLMWIVSTLFWSSELAVARLIRPDSLLGVGPRLSLILWWELVRILRIKLSRWTILFDCHTRCLWLLWQFLHLHLFALLDHRILSLSVRLQYTICLLTRRLLNRIVVASFWDGGGCSTLLILPGRLLLTWNKWRNGFTATHSLELTIEGRTFRPKNDLAHFLVLFKCIFVEFSLALTTRVKTLSAKDLLTFLQWDTFSYLLSQSLPFVVLIWWSEPLIVLLLSLQNLGRSRVVIKLVAISSSFIMLSFCLLMDIISWRLLGNHSGSRSITRLLIFEA